MEKESIQTSSVADSGLRITIMLRGKKVCDSVLMLLPPKEKLGETIRNVIDQQIPFIIEKV